MQKSNYPISFTLPILSYFGYTLYQHLHDDMYMSMLDRLDFFIHEFGHLFFNIFGNELYTIAGGTAMQLIIPLILLMMFLFQRDFFAIAFCLMWLGTNFFYIAMYAGDAIRLDLPLIGVGAGETIHDWDYILGYFDVRHHTDFIANIFYNSGLTLYIIAFIYAFFLIVNRWRQGEL